MASARECAKSSDARDGGDAKFLAAFDTRALFDHNDGKRRVRARAPMLINVRVSTTPTTDSAGDRQRRRGGARGVNLTNRNLSGRLVCRAYWRCARGVGGSARARKVSNLAASTAKATASTAAPQSAATATKRAKSLVICGGKSRRQKLDSNCRRAHNLCCDNSKTQSKSNRSKPACVREAARARVQTAMTMRRRSTAVVADKRCALQVAHTPAFARAQLADER